MLKLIAAAANGEQDVIDDCLIRFQTLPQDIFRKEHGDKHRVIGKLNDALQGAAAHRAPPASRPIDPEAVARRASSQADLRARITALQEQAALDNNIDPEERADAASELAALEAERQGKRSRELFYSGRWAKAVQSLGSNGMADTRDPVILAKVKTLFPAASPHPFPILPVDAPRHLSTAPEDVIRELQKMDATSSGGMSQLNVMHMKTLMQDPTCAKGFALMITMLKNGDISDRVAPYFRTSRLATPYKPDQLGIRPLGMTDIMMRVTGRLLSSSLPPGIEVFPNGIQLAVRTPGGSQTAAERIQSELERRQHEPDHIFVIPVDFVNAFNQRDRTKVARKYFATPAYRPAWRFFEFAYGTPSDTVTIEGVKIRVENGVIQGDPLAMDAYCLSVDNIWEQAVAAGRVADKRLSCVAIADDGAFIGTIPGLRAAIAKLRHLCDEEGINVNLPKFKLVDPHGADKPTPADALAFQVELGMLYEKGATWHLGAPIGLDNEERERLAKANIDKKAQAATAIIKSDAFPGQCVPPFAAAASTALVHIASVAPPSLTQPHLDRFALRVADAALDKWGITEADTTGRRDAVDAQLLIARKDGGFGIGAPHAPLLYYRSVARSHALLPPNASQLVYAPPSLDAIHNLPPLPAFPPPHAAPDAQQVANPQLRASFLTPTVRHALSSLINSVRQPKDPPTEAEAKLLASLPALPLQALANGRLPPLTQPTLRTATTLLRKLDTERRSAGDQRLQRRLLQMSDQTAKRFIGIIPVTGEMRLISSDKHYGDTMRFILDTPHRRIPFDYQCMCGRPPYDNDHPHRCKMCTAVSVANRHHLITRALVDIASRAGITAEPEKRADHFGASQKRGDAYLAFNNSHNGKNVLVDVAVVHVECYPNLTIDKALAQREAVKDSKYTALCVEQNREFTPLVVSSRGVLAPKALQLLKSISTRAHDFGYTTSAAHFYRNSVLSILSALHQGNLFVLNQGVSLVRRAPAAGP